MNFYKEKIIAVEEVPSKLYHIVPISLFEEYTDEQGNYDPRNKPDFGGEAPYVHTTPTIEQMNDCLDYLHQLKDKVFYLLEIEVEKLAPLKITYAQFEDRIYHHLWTVLKVGSYVKKKVEKDENGNIRL